MSNKLLQRSVITYIALYQEKITFKTTNKNENFQASDIIFSVITA